MRAIRRRSCPFGAATGRQDGAGETLSAEDRVVHNNEIQWVNPTLKKTVVVVLLLRCPRLPLLVIAHAALEVLPTIALAKAALVREVGVAVLLEAPQQLKRERERSASRMSSKR